MIKRPNNPFIKSTDIPDPFFCVIIPIKDPNISAGQLVALQALQLGKPIISVRVDANLHTCWWKSRCGD